ncbi:hypothetical protein BH11ACT8_BH11ACT8_14250 [soil metagenome]
MALVVALSGYAVTRAVGRDAGPNRCDRLAADSAQRLTQDTGTGRRIVVIGDSYSVGAGLEHPLYSWPSRLPGRVHVAGFSGSGFSADASPCGRVSYADRAPAAVRGGADLVVVEGGLNDYDRSDAAIRAGFERLVRALDGLPVLVVGPAPAPSRVDAVPRVDALLADLSAEHGVDYLSMADLELTYLGDRLHPDAAGQSVFGDTVAAGLSAQ